MPDLEDSLNFVWYNILEEEEPIRERRIQEYLVSLSNMARTSDIGEAYLKKVSNYYVKNYVLKDKNEM